MDLTIGELIPKAQTPNSFEVEILTYWGDADGYKTFVMGPFIKDQDEDALQGLLETLHRMDNAYPDGRGGYDEYDGVEGFAGWFVREFDPENDSDSDADAIGRKWKENQAGKAHIYWPVDPYADMQNSYDKHKIFYYDENQNQYAVSASLTYSA
jgi:hypothetical protein